MQISTLFVLCALVAAASAQFFQIGLPPTGTDVEVGVQSGWFFITAPAAPNTTVTVSISESTGNTDLSASSLTFTPTVQQLSFRFTTKVTGLITFDLTLDNTDQFNIQATLSVESTYRPITIDSSVTSISPLTIGLWTEPIKIYLDTPYTSQLSLTPTITTYPAGDAVPVTISPSTITIAAGDLSASFVLTGTQAFSGLVQLTWGTIGGDSDSWYAIADSTFTLTINKRNSIVTPTFSQSFLPGPSSTPLYFWTNGDRPNDTLTITPQAADTTFSPSSITLDANTQVAQFTVSTTSTEGSKPVYFYTSNTAASYFYQPSQSYLNTPQRGFTFDIPSKFAVTKPSKISIKIEYPATNDVSVTLYAANLQFNPATVAFSGATTAVDVVVTPTNLGPDTISFKVTGTDAAWYTEPNNGVPITTTVEGGTITVAGASGAWNIPALYVGQESQRIPVRLNFPPATGITVTPIAADIVFNPQNLTFTPTTVEQYFTMTPVVAGRSSAVSFAVSGADWAWFSSVASATVTPSLRLLQTAWSSDLELGETATIYAGRDYTVWVSTNYAGSSDSFTVTPVSNYFKFNPQTLTFNSGTLRGAFTATPISGVRSSTSATINYVVSGQAAGYYQALGADSFQVALRPLYFYSATISRDDRFDSKLVRYLNASNFATNPATYLPTGNANVVAALANNHVHSFSIATPAFPMSKLTITPKSAHISFSPSSVTLTSSSSTTVWTNWYSLSVGGSVDSGVWEPTYLSIANFTVSGSAPGTHNVWFELSSDDADYYITPQTTSVTIRKYSGGGSGSATVVASIGMIIASVVIALFL